MRNMKERLRPLVSPILPLHIDSWASEIYQKAQIETYGIQLINQLYLMRRDQG